MSSTLPGSITVFTSNTYLDDLVTAVDIFLDGDSYEYADNVDNIKYVSSLGGTTLLDVNDAASYLMLSFEPKSGKQKSTWRPGLQTDGDMPGERRHFGNGSLDCTCLVRGSSDSDLDLKINALVDQFRKRISYIKYKAINRAKSRWYIAYWMEEGPETSYYDVLRRQSGIEAEIKWTQQLFPYKLGAEETISMSGVASASVVNLTGIKGDGPALMDVYIDPTGSYLPSFLMLGQRELYDSDFQAVFETATGTTVSGTAAAECLNSNYQKHANPSTNLIVNGNTETVSGTPSVWANITATRIWWNGPGTLVMQTDTGQCHSGTRCVMYYYPSTYINGPANARYSLQFDAVPVTVGHTYQFSFWDLLLDFTDWDQQDNANVSFHDVSHGVTGTSTYRRTLTVHSDWQQWVINLPVVPANTTHVHIGSELYLQGRVFWTPSIRLYHDDFTLRDLSATGTGAVFAKAFPMKHKGYYEVAAQASTATTGISGDALTLQATPYHSTLGALGGEPDYSENSLIGDDGVKWRNTAMLASPFKLLPVPAGNVSENAVLTNLLEKLEMSVEATYDGGNFRSDFTALIPVDQAVARITNNLASHIILDSRSDVPAILQSLDGTLESATMMYPAQTSADLKFVANPDGVNLALLMLYNNSGSYEPRCVANLKFVYRPYYYLTP